MYYFYYVRKINFITSNADVEIVKNQFNESKYTTQIIQCKRSINAKKPNAKINEVLIKSY